MLNKFVTTHQFYLLLLFDTQSNAFICWILQTLQEKPEKVAPPYVISSGPSFLFIGWDDPVFPNGPITGYVLYDQNTVKHSGGLKSYNYTGLQVCSLFASAVDTVIEFLKFYFNIKSQNLFTSVSQHVDAFCWWYL